MRPGWDPGRLKARSTAPWSQGTAGARMGVCYKSSDDGGKRLDRWGGVAPVGARLCPVGLRAFASEVGREGGTACFSAGRRCRIAVPSSSRHQSGKWRLSPGRARRQFARAGPCGHHRQRVRVPPAVRLEQTIGLVDSGGRNRLGRSGHGRRRTTIDQTLLRSSLVQCGASAAVPP